MRLSPYPVMKDSGVPWIGAVAEHWSVLPNRALFFEVKERECPDEQMLSVTITKGVIPQKALLEGSSKKDSSNLDRSAYKLVCPGDIAYNKMRAWQGAIGVSELRGIVSPAYVVERPRDKVCARYFHHLFRTPQFAKEAERWSYGITSDMWSLRPEDFRMIYSVLPPWEEQAAVVRFLDHADKRIRRFIAAKRRMIELLNEQKQAIIQKAVTRGLDPNVRLKPSGVDWLGDVPEHWEVAQLRRRWEVVDCKHVTVPFVDEGFPLASVREVQSFDLDLSTSNRTTPEWYSHLVSGGRTPKRGDLIYCRNVSVGACAYVNREDQFSMGQDVCLIRSDNQNGRFLNYFIHSPAMQRQLSLLLIGSTFNRINVSEIKSLVIVVPPRAEQDANVAYLDSSISTYDKPIISAQKAITFIREYRTRLIADVVTGKLDVRGAELSPLEEAEELPAAGDEALDEAPEEETGLEPVEEGADAAE